MPDYTKGCVYQIVCRNPEITDKYVGSTCNLIKRRQCHKSTCNNEKNPAYHYNVYKFIREHGGWINWKLIEIEKTPCTTKTELSQHELKHFNIIKPTLNKVVMLRTPKEYRVEHVEKYKEYDKQYRVDNCEKLKEYHEKYRVDNIEKHRAESAEKIECECGSIVRKGDLSTHKRTKKHQKFIFQSQPEHIQAQGDTI